MRPAIALSIDYDGCGQVFSNFADDPLPYTSGAFPRVRPSIGLERVAPSSRVLKKRYQFWAMVLRATEGNKPHVCMSGSARVIYQDPGDREQDGIAHTDVLDEAVTRARMPGIDLTALRMRVAKDGSPFGPGRLVYDERDATRPSGLSTEVVGKLTIIKTQVEFVQKKFPGRPITFVFVDDIYATAIANALRSHPRYHFLPSDVTLHLIHYESHRPHSVVDLEAEPISVRRNVRLWSK